MLEIYSEGRGMVGYQLNQFNPKKSLVPSPETSEPTIRSIQYTGAASGEAKIRSASWEKANIPGLVTIGFTHMW